MQDELELEPGESRCPSCGVIVVPGESKECPHDLMPGMQWLREIMKDIHKEKQPLSLVEQQAAQVLRELNF